MVGDRPAAGCTQTMFPTTKVTCSLGTLAAGESVTSVLGVSWGEAGDRTVKATVRPASPADPVAADNSETETTTVPTRPAEHRGALELAGAQPRQGVLRVRERERA